MNFFDFIRKSKKRRKDVLQYKQNYHKKKTAKDVAYLVNKRIVDITGATVGIILTAPVMATIALLIHHEDGGHPLFAHERIGQFGKRIQILKFRSMKTEKVHLTKEQERQLKTEFKIDNDPRITDIGEFLRKTSLDELPQLFNILIGDLSLVGPRPLVEEELEIYGDNIAKLLSVKPGLTGYWQAYARNRATYKTGQRQHMEMYYVDHHSLMFDFHILMHTFSSVIHKRGAQ